MSHPGTFLRLLGFKELHDQLLALGAVAGVKVMARAARAAFTQVEADAKALVPVDTGQLRESIRLKVAKPKAGAPVVVGLRISKRVTAPLQTKISTKGMKKGAWKYLSKAAKRAIWRQSAHWRWHFVEFGVPSYGQPARPFLRPAFYKNQQHILDSLKVELRKAIDRELRRRQRAAVPRRV